jgi:hypothetical protein
MPYKEIDRICETCIYFLAFDIEESDGMCRVKAPTLFFDENDDAVGYFPITSKTQACGEGLWKKVSEITGKVETWGFEDDERCFEENVRETQTQDKCCNCT